MSSQLVPIIFANPLDTNSTHSVSSLAIIQCFFKKKASFCNPPLSVTTKLQFFSSSIGKMIPFAMTASFISAPVFAYLNYSLSKQYEKPTWLTLLALLGLIYLASMVVVYFIFF